MTGLELDKHLQTKSWNRHIQESRGPLGPTSQNSLKKVFPGLPTRSVKESVEKNPKGPKNRERKISPKFFRPTFFHGRPRGLSVPKCLFFQHLEGLTEVFGRMSAGISGQKKLPLWAEFPFLKKGVKKMSKSVFRDFFETF